MENVKAVASNEALRDAVENELKWDPRVDEKHIGVSANDGAITLTGEVSSYPERIAATHAAERVFGVRAVADDVEVVLPAAAGRDDTAIAEEIARQRKWNTAIPASVQAEVRHGHVTLRGEVEWSFQRRDAEQAIAHLAGIQGVNNAIIVKPGVRPNKVEAVRHAEAAIERMANLDARSIWVTTNDGVAYLHGRVHSLAEREVAERAVESTPGVTTVINEIVVAG